MDLKTIFWVHIDCLWKVIHRWIDLYYACAKTHFIDKKILLVKCKSVGISRLPGAPVFLRWLRLKNNNIFYWTKRILYALRYKSHAKTFITHALFRYTRIPVSANEFIYLFCKRLCGLKFNSFRFFCIFSEKNKNKNKKTVIEYNNMSKHYTT